MIQTYFRNAVLRLCQFTCLVSISSVGVAQAQGSASGGGVVDAYFDMDVLKRANVEERMQALGNDLLGDQIDPNTGSLSFSHTDISIPGNSGLAVAIQRTRSFGDPYTQFNNDYTASNGKASLSFGDWELGVPNVSIVTATPYSVCDSTEPPSATTFLNLTSGGQPLPANAENETLTDGQKHSNGVRVSVPGGTSGLLLDNPVSSLVKTGANKTSLDHWSFECITTGDGGLIGTAPNGDEYRFDQEVFRPAKRINMQSATNNVTNSSYSYGFQERTQLVYQVSRVKDVNDNWVDYTYNAQGWLTKIESNDNRIIDITRDAAGFIDEIDANGRKWKYTYFNKANGGRLTDVERPDHSKWTFDLSAMTYDPKQYHGDCGYAPYSNSVTVTHPHGAVGTFTFEDTKHLRAKPPLPSTSRYPQVLHCADLNDPDSADPDASAYSPYNIVASVTEKSLKLNATDANPSLWTYDYSADSLPLSQGQKWSDVTDPSGTRVRRMYHVNDEIELDSLINWAKTYNGAGAVISETQFDYEFEAPVGTTWLENENINRLTRPRRTIKTHILQDDDTYTTEQDYELDHTSADYAFGAAHTTRKFSSVSMTAREVVQTFEHQTAKWILGLPKTVHINARPITTYTYDTKGRLTDQTRYGQDWLELSYNADGTVEWMEDALDRRTTADLWKRGTPQKITRPDGISEYQYVDNNGWVTSQKNAMNRTTAYENDNMGRLKKIDPYGTWTDTLINYDFSGDGVIQTITKGAAKTTVTYDSLLRSTLERTQDITPSATWESYVNTKYDALGRVIFKSQPSASATETKGSAMTYDGLGRILTEKEEALGGGTTTHSYHMGHIYRVKDPSGAETDYVSYGYDGPGNKDYSAIINSDGNRQTDIIKNIWGEVTEVTQGDTDANTGPLQTQSFLYDAQRRLCAHETAEGNTTKYEYDLAGQMTAYAKGQTHLNCGVIGNNAARVGLEYDNLGRLTKTDFTDPGTHDIARTYDANGNIKTVKRAKDLTLGTDRVNWFYGYNDADLLTSEALYVDNLGFVTTYEYNTDQHLVKQIYPTGRPVDYKLDGLGRPTKLSGWGHTYVKPNTVSYHPSGTLTGFEYGNGQVYLKELNDRLLPERLFSETVGGTTALDLNYTYDARGKIMTINDYAVANNNRSFTYDALGQLKTSTGPWGTQTNSYDSLGNILSRTMTGSSEGNRTITLGYDAKNRVDLSTDSLAASSLDWGGTGTGTRAVGYDSRGNVTSLGTMTFTYDYSDQPTVLNGTRNGTSFNSSSYVYDGNLKRVKSTVNGRTVYNIYSLSGELLHVRDEDPLDGGLLEKTDYIGMGGMSVVRAIQNQGLYYEHSDHLGSPVAQTYSSGGIATQTRYTPFGMAMDDPNLLKDQGGFTGHIKDSATGLNYMQARYYDPVMGRFLGIDPLGFLNTGKVSMFNRYAYADNDPMNKIDPLGMAAEGVCDEGHICWQVSQPNPMSDPNPLEHANDNTPQIPNDEPDNSRRRDSSNAGGLASGLASGLERAHELGRKLRLKDEYNENPDAFIRLFRFHGGLSKPYGRSWTYGYAADSEDPRDLLGIPNVNSMSFISAGYMKVEDYENPLVVTHRPALPIPSEGLTGGGPEVLITAPYAKPYIIIVDTKRYRGGK